MDNKPESGHYERLNFHHRIQHGLLAISIIALIMTGFPLKFPQLGFSKALVIIFGGAYGAAMVHRFFGLVMCASVAYHVIYLLYRYAKGDRSWAMVLTVRDAVEAYETLLYWLSIRKTLPRYGRYNYLEKLEYLGVAFGSSIMVLTGVALWFPIWATQLLPNWIMELSFRAHSQEALLAATVIFMWHFYFVHLSPVEFPMNTAFLDGKCSLKSLRYNHPREYEELYGEEVPEEERLPPHRTKLTPGVWRGLAYGSLATLLLCIGMSWVLAGRVLARSEPNAPIEAEILTVSLSAQRPAKTPDEAVLGVAAGTNGVQPSPFDHRCRDCHRRPIETSGKISFNHYLHSELKVVCVECHAVGHSDSRELVGGPAACYKCHERTRPDERFSCSSCHPGFDDSRPIPASHKLQ